MTVNALMPGYTVTERLQDLRLDLKTLAPRFPRAGWAARRTSRRWPRFCSEQANYVTGQALACDGGLLQSI